MTYTELLLKLAEDNVSIDIEMIFNYLTPWEVFTLRSDCFFDKWKDKVDKKTIRIFL